MSFDDLLESNRQYAEHFPYAGYAGVARKGVLMITCMDSRIDPIDVVGLGHGDAKVLRSPGGIVSEPMLTGCIVGVHLLGVERIMVMQHTKCAMASGTDADVCASIAERSGLDATWVRFGASPQQLPRLEADVALLRSHPLLKDRVEVGGFMYDVDTGLLKQVL